jgi:hypothetical protein
MDCSRGSAGAPYAILLLQNAIASCASDFHGLLVRGRAKSGTITAMTSEPADVIGDLLLDAMRIAFLRGASEISLRHFIESVLDDEAVGLAARPDDGGDGVVSIKSDRSTRHVSPEPRHIVGSGREMPPSPDLVLALERCSALGLSQRDDVVSYLVGEAFKFDPSVPDYLKDQKIALRAFLRAIAEAYGPGNRK